MSIDILASQTNSLLTGEQGGLSKLALLALAAVSEAALLACACLRCHVSLVDHDVIALPWYSLGGLITCRHCALTD